MKHSIFILIVVFVVSVFSSSVVAQTEKKEDASKIEKENNGKKKGENDHIKWFKAFRRDFLVKKTQMTKEEADAFFPLYDELGDKKFKLHIEVGEKMKKVWDESKATEQDYNAVLDAKEDVLQKEAALDKEYSQKFRKILPAKKMFRLRMAEDEFSREWMKHPDKNRDKDKKENAPAPERDRRPEPRPEAPKR